MLPTHSQSSAPVTTDWDDIQRRIGNLPPLEPPPPKPEWEPEDAINKRLNQTLGADPSAPDDRLDDTSADVEAFEQWRASRMHELKGEIGRYGFIVHITKGDFISEVNQADAGVGVVVFLFKQRHYHSQYMLVLIEKLARKFRHVKFCQISHDDCIPGYPDYNLPTLLMYRDDDLLHQCIGVGAFGGSGYGIDDVEWEIAVAGLVHTELEQNPHSRRHR
mgnify:CR=1 FL=1